MAGVVRTRVGYAGGTAPSPTYRSLGDHTETIQVDYDPSVVTYDDLLDVFWHEHDARYAPHSRQYRSAVFYSTEEERAAAEASKARIEAAVGPVTTAIEPLERFHLAEGYHQKYRLRGSRDLYAEFRAMYPDERDFVDSTAAARVNGWLDGYGTSEQVEASLPGLGLSERVGRALADSVTPRGLLGSLR